MSTPTARNFSAPVGDLYSGALDRPVYPVWTVRLQTWPCTWSHRSTSRARHPADGRSVPLDVRRSPARGVHARRGPHRALALYARAATGNAATTSARGGGQSADVAEVVVRDAQTAVLAARRPGRAGGDRRGPAETWSPTALGPLLPRPGAGSARPADTRNAATRNAPVLTGVAW
jgi:hypothetical protein